VLQSIKKLLPRMHLSGFSSAVLQPLMKVRFVNYSSCVLQPGLSLVLCLLCGDHNDCTHFPASPGAAAAAAAACVSGA
jgi:hypothetical protein